MDDKLRILIDECRTTINECVIIDNDKIEELSKKLQQY